MDILDERDERCAAHLKRQGGGDREFPPIKRSKENRKDIQKKDNRTTIQEKMKTSHTGKRHQKRRNKVGKI